MIDTRTHNTTQHNTNNSRRAYARALAEVAAQLQLVGHDAGGGGGGGGGGKTILDISDGAALASLFLKEGVVGPGAGARPVVVSLEVGPVGGLRWSTWGGFGVEKC